MLLDFNIDKSICATGYLIERAGGCEDMFMLLKKVYFADRSALIGWGQSITGDRLASLEKGPVVRREWSAVSWRHEADRDLRPAMEMCTSEFDAIVQELLRDDSCSAERRLLQWSGLLTPGNAIEEYLLEKIVELSIELDRAGLARKEKMLCRIEKAAKEELQKVHELGSRLFFDRLGHTDMYGLSRDTGWDRETTSWSGKAVDPDDPAMLVKELESSLAGCK